MNRLKFCMMPLMLISTLLGIRTAFAQNGSIATVPEPSTAAAGLLREYVEKLDDSYRWRKIREGKVGKAEYAELILYSQTWRGILWKHQLWIVRPTEKSQSKQALLFIAGGRWQDELEDATHEPRLSGETVLLADLACRLESPIAIISHVPYQPMFGGMVEDQIISYTFERFIVTGETDWPLLLPMVKSAVRAMDATREFCQEEWQWPIDSFVVSGGSKRGWTTWLVGAHDKRVNAIAPMVIDMLHMAPQMDHQLEAWGTFSDEIHDYTARGLQHVLKTPAGEKLASIVDPYSYRDSLELPKIIVNGTNDRYWPVDALNLYWDDLPGEKHALYIPNQGHSIRDAMRLLGALAALHRDASGERSLPESTWKFEDDGDSVSVAIDSDRKMHTCQLWSASSSTKDFRDATWKVAEEQRDTKDPRFKIEKPTSGYRAFFAEMLYDEKPFPLYLSTNLRVVGAEEAEGN